jgi:DNA-binding GntR family transcriptional regulator
VPIPLTGADITADIAAKISHRTDGYAPGDELPSTRELADEYGVSPATIYRAVATLRQQGILVGRKGRGVFVAMP